MTTVLSIPLALRAAVLLTGLGLFGIGLVGIVRRVLVLAEVAGRAPAGPSTPLSSPYGLVWSVVGVGLGALALVTALRWWRVQVRIDAEALTYRRWWHSSRVPLDELKGVVLTQAGGLPQLRIVPLEAATVVLPAWSLQATHDDGEVEPAAVALPRLGGQHGFRVKVRSLFSEA